MADNGAGVFLSLHLVRLLAAASADAPPDWLPEIARGKTDIKQQTISGLYSFRDDPPGLLCPP
jgi:hypothetical protein